jgi:hypothetical protein
MRLPWPAMSSPEMAPGVGIAVPVLGEHTFVAFRPDAKSGHIKFREGGVFGLVVVLHEELRGNLCFVCGLQTLEGEDAGWGPLAGAPEGVYPANGLIAGVNGRALKYFFADPVDARRAAATIFCIQAPIKP